MLPARDQPGKIRLAGVRKSWTRVRISQSITGCSHHRIFKYGKRSSGRELMPALRIWAGVPGLHVFLRRSKLAHSRAVLRQLSYTSTATRDGWRSQAVGTQRPFVQGSSGRHYRRNSTTSVPLATRITAAMPMNSPCSTTPGISLSLFAKPSAPRIFSKWQSRM